MTEFSAVGKSGIVVIICPDTTIVIGKRSTNSKE
jgi:hypothetical protein